MFRKYPDNINDIIVQTLIFLISKTEDTNILYRSDHKVLSHFKIMANEALIEGGILSSEGRRKIDDMKSFALLKNISPGGSADLVSCTLLIYLLECYNNKKYNVK